MANIDDKKKDDTRPQAIDLLPVIPAGQAQRYAQEALQALAGAYLRAEGVTMSLARALDEAAARGGAT